MDEGNTPDLNKEKIEDLYKEVTGEQTKAFAAKAFEGIVRDTEVMQLLVVASSDDEAKKSLMSFAVLRGFLQVSAPFVWVKTVVTQRFCSHHCSTVLRSPTNAHLPHQVV